MAAAEVYRLTETFGSAKAFSRGEGGAAPEQVVICIVAICYIINVKFTASFAVP